MSGATRTFEGELSRRQFVRQTALTYWAAAGAAGSGMLALPAPGMRRKGRGRSIAARRHGPSRRAAPVENRSLPCHCLPLRCAAPRRKSPLPPHR